MGRRRATCRAGYPGCSDGKAAAGRDHAAAAAPNTASATRAPAMSTTAGASATIGSNPAPRASGSCHTTSADASTTTTTTTTVVARAARPAVRRCSPRRSAIANTAASATAMAITHGQDADHLDGTGTDLAGQCGGHQDADDRPDERDGDAFRSICSPCLRAGEAACPDRQGLVLPRRGHEARELRHRRPGDERDEQDERRRGGGQRRRADAHEIRHLFGGQPRRGRLARRVDRAAKPGQHEAHGRHRGGDRGGRAAEEPAARPGARPEQSRRRERAAIGHGLGPPRFVRR